MAKSIKQYARQYEVEQQDLVRAYRQYDSLCREADYIPPKIKYVKQALKALGVSLVADEIIGSAVNTENTEISEQGLIVLNDVLRNSSASKSDLPFPVYVHTDILEQAEEKGDISEQNVRRLTLLLQHLAAHGRTSVVKGCSGNNNNGWRRSPLGGSNGMQHYLWWAPAGAPPVKHLGVASQSIYVRGIRHHDDHDTLLCGSLDDYISLSASELNPRESSSRSIFISPWTIAQLAFARSEHPVRVLQGCPGTGKTAALWQAINMRAGEQVLYLTWNKSLAIKAGEYFCAFAPQESEVRVWTFERLINELGGIEEQNQSYEKAEKEFYAAISRLSAQQAGTWQRIPHILFEEIRAHYVGVSLILKDGLPARFEHSNPADYRRSRGSLMGSDCDSFLKIVKLLENDGPLDRFFPDLATVKTAMNSLLAMDALPDSFSLINRLVVDEAQDLTRLELSLLCVLARRIAEKQDKKLPFMLFAGDEAQTVRPTDFRWSSMKSLLNDFLHQPQEFPLEHNVRSPRDIGMLINRVTELYAFLEKDKPKGIGDVKVDDATNARIYHCVTHSSEELNDALRYLADHPEFPLINPAEKIGAAIPEEIRSFIRSPSAVKGLDYQNACILNLGNLLGKLAEEIHVNRRDKDFERFWKRKLVDGLRVALSRATETLVVLDIDPSEEELRRSREFLEAVEAVPVNASELIDQIKKADMGADELVQMMIQDALRNLDNQINLAVRRARQAVKLLGRAGTPNGVTDVTLRREAFLTLAKTLLSQFNIEPGAKDAGDVLHEIATQCKNAGLPDTDRLFRKIENYVRADKESRQQHLWDVIDLLPSGGKEVWVLNGLVKQYTEWGKVIVEAMSNTRYAREAAIKIEPFISYIDRGKINADKLAKINHWRLTACETLIHGEKFDQGLEVVELILPPNQKLKARCFEGLMRYEEAAELFEQEGDFESAYRVSRRVPSLEDAIHLMKLAGKAEDDLPALEWLKAFDQLIKNKPANLKDYLTVEEKKLMKGLVKGL